MSTEIPVSYEEGTIDPHYGPMIVAQPAGTLLPARYKQYANSIYNFKYRHDDIALVSLPRSGNTWTAEIIWAMTHIEDLHKAYKEHINNRVFILDNDFLQDLNVDALRERLKSKHPKTKEEDGITQQLADLEEERRVIWCHLPLSLQNPCLLDKCKVVYLIRHPKDNLISRFNLLAKVIDVTVEEDLPQIAETFMTGDTLYGPYWYHIQDAWMRKEHPNLHIMFYEDMKADIMSELERLNSFLKLDLTYQQLQKVSEHTSFSNMKNHKTMTPDILGFKGSFLHKGQVGASKGMFPKELDDRMDAWIKENANNLGVGFNYYT